MKPTTDDVLALLEEHGGRLHALIVRLTLRYDVAEDLMQDLFCKLVGNQRLAAATSPLAYATRMATNLAFDFRRAQRRIARSELATDRLPDAPRSPIADLVRREEFDQLLDAIGRLPGNGREIVVLRYLEQQDYQAIARQMGKTPHQIRAICHKAVVRLRVLLDVERARITTRRRPTP